MSEKPIKLTLGTELSLLAEKVPSQRTLELVIQPPATEQNKPRPLLNLALVLDRSGSMSGDKLEFAKLAAYHLVDQLGEADQVSVVAFDDDVTQVAKSALATSETRRRIKQSLAEIKTGGSTNLSEGWLTGCGEVAAHPLEGELARTLLLTDGQANRGIIELEELAMHARELCRKGVSTSTFGVGEDFNEHLLEAMANAGGGHYYWIGDPHEIPGIFAREFGELAEITARDVELMIDIPAGVAATVLGSWPLETLEGRMRISIGALQAGQPQPIYVTLLFPAKEASSKHTLKCQVMGRGEANQVYEDTGEITFLYADPKTIEVAPCEEGLLARGAQVRLEEAVNEALKLERAGEREKAYSGLRQAIEACRPYLNPEEIEKFTPMAERMHCGMDEIDRKSTHYQNYINRRSRSQN